MSSQFLAKVSFVNKISVLMKATSDDDKPIPGHLYEEISKISKESDENCETLMDFLNDRLSKDSSHVKLKVLKLIKYVVENGHPNFRLALLKKSNGIREATKHSGPPDPLHGNVPYVMVRKMAESVSETLFNTDTATAQSEQQKPSVSTLGLGSNAKFDSSRSSKMEGFGNTSAIQNKSLGENIKEGLMGLVERLGETTTDHQRELLSTLDGSKGYTPPKNTQSPDVFTDHWDMNQKTPAPAIEKRPASVPKHIPGKAGGGWDDSDDDVTDDVINGKQTTKSDSSSYVETLERLDNNVLVDYAAEQTVVSSYIDADNGSSILLTRQQLKCFIKECSGLNCDKIVEFLNVQLSSTSDQTIMRSLMLLEVLMNSDLVNLERLVRVCRDAMVSVVTERDGQPKSKSKKLIRILEKLTSQHSILEVSRPEVDVES